MMISSTCTLTFTLLLVSLILHDTPAASAFIVAPLTTRTATTKLHNNNNDNNNKSSQLTDWVIENLEDDDNKITSSSKIKAGENDTLPPEGLCMARVRILAAESTFVEDDENDNEEQEEYYYPIRLLVGRNGWGTGVHPTTRLCLEWLSQSVQDGQVLFDYGCGSGILSIAAMHFGASKSIGVDVEAEALVTAERNMELNGFYDGRFEGLHTREILPYEFQCDLCVANILIGQLVRPSMVSALVTNIVPGGLLCLSGIRPNQVDALKKAYDDHVDEWLDYDELAAEDTEGSIDSYGFDVGQWARVVGRIKKKDRDTDVQTMSELAVS